MRGPVRGALALAVMLALPACKGERKRGLGLAHRDGGAPVVVVEQQLEGGAVGPISPEVEPNDRRDQAAALEVPGGVKGALSRPDDVDFYRIEAGPARMVAMRLHGPPADEGGGDLVLELFDADGRAVARSDRGPAGTLEGLPNAPLAQGARYFVAVSQIVKKASRRKQKGAAEEPPGGGSASRYQLTIEPVTARGDEEVEPNDKPEAARPVLLAEEKSGYLGWSKDQDLWQLDLSGFSGGHALDVAVDGVEGVSLAVDILAADGRVLAARKGQKDRALLVRGLLPELGARWYLARISGSRSNPEQSYHIRPTSRALEESDEAEPNDEPARAISVGTLGDGAAGERRGFVDGGDTDMYKLEAGREALALTVSVEAPATIDLVLRVLGPSGAEVARADNGKAGQREEVAALRVGRGEARFVAVSGNAQGDEADGYVLRWSGVADLRAPSPPAQPQTDSPGETLDDAEQR